MLPGNILTLPLAIMLTYSDQSAPPPSSGWASVAEHGAEGQGQGRTPGRWSTSPWGPCSNPCGPGEERRQVLCVLEDVTATLIVGADSFCSPPKPTAVRQCHQYRDECVNAWVSGDWGQCSARCGGGQRSRLVECHAGTTPAWPGPGPGHRGPAANKAEQALPEALPEARCVPELKPGARKDCNLQPCPDGRRVWLHTSDGLRPRRRRVYLFTKFSLRCPFAVYKTPADDRTKRKYAWFKDGQRLPLHEDKYTQIDSRGELRIKGADEADSGVYKCVSLTANPQGREHNITVRLERVPGETAAPPILSEDDDVEDSDEREEGDLLPVLLPAPTDADEPPPPATPGPGDIAKDEREEGDLLPVLLPGPTSADEPPATPGPGDASVPGEATAPTTPASPRPPAAVPDEPGVTPAEAELSTEPTATATATADSPTETSESMAQTPDAAAAPAERSKRDLTPSAVEQEQDDQDSEEEVSEASGSNGVVVVVAARYEPSPFSDCSATCGGAGLRQRAVRCVDSETGKQLPLADCEDLGPPPSPQEPCNRVDCPPAWQWPPWAGIKCSRRCGGGDRWRQALCSQTLANGTEIALGPDACTGPGEERQGCRRAPCQVRVREGEIILLNCSAANVTWRHSATRTRGPSGPRSVDLANTAKYFADHDGGKLFVFAASSDDAGQYLCDEAVEKEDGVVSSHRFEVTVLPPTPVRSRGQNDDLVVRVCETTTTVGEVETGTEEQLPEAMVTEAPGTQTSTEPGPSVPWHLLLKPAAPSKGRILGVFS